MKFDFLVTHFNKPVQLWFEKPAFCTLTISDEVVSQIILSCLGNFSTFLMIRFASRSPSDYSFCNFFFHWRHFLLLFTSSRSNLCTFWKACVFFTKFIRAWKLWCLFCKISSKVRFLITDLWISLKKGGCFDFNHSLGSLP